VLCWVNCMPFDFWVLGGKHRPTAASAQSQGARLCGMLAQSGARGFGKQLGVACTWVRVVLDSEPACCNAVQVYSSGGSGCRGTGGFHRFVGGAHALVSQEHIGLEGATAVWAGFQVFGAGWRRTCKQLCRPASRKALSSGYTRQACIGYALRPTILGSRVRVQTS
jgi:hypothetical protein